MKAAGLNVFTGTELIRMHQKFDKRWWIPGYDFICWEGVYPGRMYGSYGPKSSLKTTLMLRGLCGFLRQDRLKGELGKDEVGAAILDCSGTIDGKFLNMFVQQHGISPNNLMLVSRKDMTVEKMADATMGLFKEGVIRYALVDDLATIPINKEIDNETAKSQMGDRPRMTSKFIARLTPFLDNAALLFTQQVREKMDFFGGQSMPGGHHFNHALSLLMHQARAGKKEWPPDNVGGFTIRARVEKTKLSSLPEGASILVPFPAINPDGTMYSGGEVKMQRYSPAWDFYWLLLTLKLIKKKAGSIECLFKPFEGGYRSGHRLITKIIPAMEDLTGYCELMDEVRLAYTTGVRSSIVLLSVIPTEGIGGPNLVVASDRMLCNPKSKFYLGVLFKTTDDVSRVIVTPIDPKTGKTGEAYTTEPNLETVDICAEDYRPSEHAVLSGFKNHADLIQVAAHFPMTVAHKIADESFLNMVRRQVQSDTLKEAFGKVEGDSE